MLSLSITHLTDGSLKIVLMFFELTNFMSDCD